MERGERVKKLLALSAALVGALAIGLVPAGAITNGTPDGEGHPYVGLMVAYADADATQPLWRCSGTLMSSTVFMVAGHCTEAPARRARDLVRYGLAEARILLGCRATWRRPNCCPASRAVRAPVPSRVLSHTHPQYDPNAFFLHDLGRRQARHAGRRARASVLFRPRVSSAICRSTLPSRLSATGSRRASRITRRGRTRRCGSAWSRLRGSAASTTTTWGTSRSRPPTTPVRGGICFGDSGGPNFIGDSNVVGGVTSFGTTSTCKGHNGAYRVDQPDDLEWLEDEFGLTP